MNEERIFVNDVLAFIFRKKIFSHIVLDIQSCSRFPFLERRGSDPNLVLGNNNIFRKVFRSFTTHLFSCIPSSSLLLFVLVCCTQVWVAHCVERTWNQTCTVPNQEFNTPECWVPYGIINRSLSFPARPRPTCTPINSTSNTNDADRYLLLCVVCANVGIPTSEDSIVLNAPASVKSECTCVVQRVCGVGRVFVCVSVMSYIF